MTLYKVMSLVAAFLLIACGTPEKPMERPESQNVKTEINASLSSQDLVGVWDVALYFDPNSPPSATVMDIQAVNDDGTLEGSFYQSPFEIARFSQRNDVVIITIITSDGSGPYNTSARLYSTGQFEGQTLSTRREFLMPWTATKRASSGN